MRPLWSGCFTICWLFASSAYSQERCVPQEKIATHGVRLGNDEADVRVLLGKPQKVSAGTSEDDGGTYPTRTLRYESLVIILGRNSVESIKIRGNGHPIAEGLIVGASPNTLRSQDLVDNTNLQKGVAFNVRFCGADELPIAGLSIFVSHGKVTGAELYAYGP